MIPPSAPTISPKQPLNSLNTLSIGKTIKLQKPSFHQKLSFIGVLMVGLIAKMKISLIMV